MVDIEAEMLRLLDDPQQVWRDAFSQLPAGARCSFLTLLSLGGEAVDVEELRQCVPTIDTDITFLDGLQVLDDSFVSIEAHSPKSVQRYVSVRHPSLLDFGWALLDTNLDLFQRLYESIRDFGQLETILQAALSEAPQHPGLEQWVRAHRHLIWGDALSMIERDLPRDAAQSIGSLDTQWVLRRVKTRLEFLLGAGALLGLPKDPDLRGNLETVVREVLENAPAGTSVSLIRDFRVRRLVDDLAPSSYVQDLRAHALGGHDWGAVAWLEKHLEGDGSDWLEEFEEYVNSTWDSFTSGGSVDVDDVRALNDVIGEVSRDFEADVAMVQIELQDWIREIEGDYGDDDEDRLSHQSSPQSMSSSTDDWFEVDRLFAQTLD